jgi:hypothetical protein
MLGVYMLNYKLAYSNAILHEDHSMPLCAFGVCGVGFLCSFRARGRNSTAVKNQCACERECEEGAPPPFYFRSAATPAGKLFCISLNSFLLIDEVATSNVKLCLVFISIICCSG